MNNETVQVCSRADVPRAVAFVRQRAQAEGDAAVRVPLICEALLIRLLTQGSREIAVSVHPGRYVQFLSPVREGGQPSVSPLNEGERIEEEINRSLVNQYAGYIRHRRVGDTDRYRIAVNQAPEADLSRELTDIYNEKSEQIRKRPLTVFSALAGKHRGTIILSMVIKTVKHLGALLLPVFASNIIDAVAAGSPFFSWPVFRNVIGSLLALLTNLVCFWADSLLYHRFTRGVETAFKMTIVQKLETLSIQYHRKAQSGRILSKLISDVQAVGVLIYDRLGDMLHLCIDVVFVIVIALIRFPPMLLFYIVIVPAATMLINRFVGPILESKAFMRRQTENASSVFKEMLEMSELTRAQGLQKTEYRRVSDRVRLVQEASERFDQIGVWVNNVSYGGAQGFRLLCLCAAAFLASQGRISIGTVVLFQSVFEMIINSLQKVLDEMPQITQGYDSLVSVNEILLEENVEQNGALILKKPVRGAFSVRNVTFRYADEAAPVLDGVSFDVPAGSSAALIGSSGSGKSTMLSLLLGLETPQSGEILVDGVNLQELDKNSYRRYVAVVPQNTVLFSGTLWDNLVYGIEYASRERVMAALEQVGLSGMVAALPEGLNTPVQEGGSNFSGGQRQRVAIARALLRDAKIILFDEATSALDDESERQVQAAIDAVMGSCTVIMVAHRLHTLRGADRFYRLENGRIRAYDSYEQVMDEIRKKDLQ